MHRPAPAPRRRGFSLAELLVVVAIIAILVAGLVVISGRVSQSGRGLKCLSNQRQINNANTNFATDNNGLFMSPRTDPFEPGVDDDRVWVRAYGSSIGLNGAPAGQARTFTFEPGVTRERDVALIEGAAYPYLEGGIEIYKSPLDPTGRVRSYAISAYIGEANPDSLGELALPAGVRAARSLSDLPKPSRTIATIGEEDKGAGCNRPASFNNQGWAIKPATDSQGWFDFPADWLGGATTVSFADGSTETLTFIEPDLIKELENRAAAGFGCHRATYLGSGGGPYTVQNSDFRRFQALMLPGKVDPPGSFPWGGGGG